MSAKYCIGMCCQGELLKYANKWKSRSDCGNEVEHSGDEID
jgi:hypothetical protein